jgi:hypothetical protein
MKYVGFDWGSQAHDVTVLDSAGEVVDRWTFPHSEAGWLVTLDRLRRHGLPDDLPRQRGTDLRPADLWPYL